MTAARQPRLIGILNITADSFSDGGRYLEPDRALAHARKLVADGADIVELGPASSHPDAEKVSAELEIERLEKVIEALMAEQIPLSVDSFQTATQRYCLESGIRMLNDIQGFPDPSLWGELAAASCDLVVMHAVQESGPATRTAELPESQSSDIVERIDHFFESRLTDLAAAGIERERIILDPGMGFFLAPTPGPSVEALRSIAMLRKKFACRVLVSVSRKSFLGSICADRATGSPRSVEDRLPATLAAELFAARQRVDFIRTHDIRSLRDALRVSIELEGDSFFDGNRGDESAARTTGSKRTKSDSFGVTRMEERS
jgi:dihydropteroate synthase type 2